MTATSTGRRPRRHSWRARTAALGLAAASLVAVGPPAAAQVEPTGGGAVIGNGVVKLGVNQTGQLNLFSPSEGRVVGVQYQPTGSEATAPGCECEGWGAADAITRATGYANDAIDGVVNLDPVSFTTGTEPDGSGTANVVTRIDDVLEVEHDYHPSATPNLYEARVTITNISDAPVEPRYRRVMDWDVEPTPFNEFVTIEGEAKSLLYSSNNGFETANPLGGRSSLGHVGPPMGPEFVDAGPNDHGALFDFGFDALPAGQSLSFNIYYGAAEDETRALQAVDFVGATLYSLGKPNTGETPVDGRLPGAPNTFVFGFSAVGGGPLERLVLRKRADAGSSERGGANGFTISMVNGNAFPARVDELVDTLPNELAYVTGSSRFGGAPIADPVRTVGPDETSLAWSGPFAIAPESTGLLSFDVRVRDDAAFETYRDVATGSAVNATTGAPLLVRSTGPVAPVSVTPPAVASGTVVTTPSGGISEDGDGDPVISMARGARSDVTITTTVTCPSGQTLDAVSLTHGSGTFEMVQGADGRWTGTVPKDALVDGLPIVLVATCNGAAVPNDLVTIVLYDPSGIITDRVTGAPVTGATVTLFSVPFAVPDTSTTPGDCRTVETRTQPTWEAAPAYTGTGGVEVDESVEPATISPQVNPQTTNSAGRYGWDVAAGCYYIVVEADGYQSRTSPLVGVPPEVTDLDLTLQPLPTSTPEVETLYTVVGGNLYSFSRANGALQLVGPTVGLRSGDRVAGLDVRPATGALYAIGTQSGSSQLYTVSTLTGALTAVGGPFSPGFGTAGVGFDFNPQVDRIRIIGTSGQNLRLNPDTGAVTAVDKNIKFVAGDPSASSTPFTTAAAYINPDNDPATPTRLFDLQHKRAALLLQDPPNDGIVSTVGALGFTGTNRNGFDVAEDGVALLAVKPGTGAPALYRVDLTTGAPTKLVDITLNGRATEVESLASSTS